MAIDRADGDEVTNERLKLKDSPSPVRGLTSTLIGNSPFVSIGGDMSCMADGERWGMWNVDRVFEPGCVEWVGVSNWER